jgi:hypothetical protein
MNSVPQVQTAEISDAELDNVSGGLSPQVGITAGPLSLNSADLTSQLQGVVSGVQGQLMGALGGANQVGVTASI